MRLATDKAARELFTLQEPRRCEACDSVFEPRVGQVSAGVLLAAGLVTFVGTTYGVVSDILSHSFTVSNVVAIIAVVGSAGFLVTGIRFWRLRGNAVVHDRGQRSAVSWKVRETGASDDR